VLGYKDLQDELTNSYKVNSELRQELERCREDHRQTYSELNDANVAIEQLNDFIETRRHIDDLFNKVEQFTKEETVKLIDKFKDLPDSMINIVMEYLTYFKFDYVTKSLRIYHNTEDIAFRSWAISSIDAMILILEQTKKEKQFTNRITWVRTTTQKPLENEPQE